MERKKRLIIHIGTIKAGSTSIQQSLGRGRDTLLEHDIYFPSINPYNHAFSFAPIFMDDPTESFVFKKELLVHEDKRTKTKNYRKAWLNEFKASEQGHFIISGEGFSQPFFREDDVKRLKEFVKHFFDAFTIIIYVRHYDSWILSQTQQMIKNGLGERSTREITSSLLNCPSEVSYQHSLNKWINVFDRENIVVRPFDPKVFYKGSLLADFFHSVGLPADDLQIPEFRTNESIGKYAVTFLQKYNQAYPLFVNNSINKDRGLARQYFPVHLLKNIPDEKFKAELNYSAEQAERFNEEIDFVNQFFIDGYQFQRVSPGSHEMNFPSAEDIPIDFFVELANNYNKRLEFFHGQVKTLKKQNVELREDHPHLHRIMSALRIPFFLRVINRLPFFKIVFRKVLN